MPDGAVQDRDARVNAAQDRDARVNALVREALETEAIKKHLDGDKDFRRQVDDAAHEICEKYGGQDTGERIVRGVIKTATAIRKKEVEVFVSYKKKYEEDTQTDRGFSPGLVGIQAQHMVCTRYSLGQ